MQSLDAEPEPPQQPDPVPMRRMELSAPARPTNVIRGPLSTLQPDRRDALVLRHAERRQQTVGEKHEPSTRSQYSRSLGKPPFRITPRSRAMLADHQVERLSHERHPLRIR